MSDQSVQNMVSSVKTVCEIFKLVITNTVGDKAKEVEALKKKLEQMEKEGKTKEKEYEDTKKKLGSYEKANLDFEKVTNDIDKFMGQLEKDQTLQQNLYNGYKSNLISELKNKGITKDNIDNYDKLPEDKKATIKSCRQQALLDATEELAKTRDLDVPIATFAKDKGVLQQKIEKAITKSKDFNMKNAKEDLNKIKDDLVH